MTMPLRVRLTAWFAALLAVIVLALGTFLVLQLRTDLRHTIDTELQTSSAIIIQDVADHHAPEGPAEDPEDAAENVSQDVIEDARDFDETVRAMLPQTGGAAQLLTREGAVRARYGSVASPEPLVSRDALQAAVDGRPGTLTSRLGGDEQPYRVRVTAFSDGTETSVLVVALSTQPIEDAVQRVLRLLLLAGPAALAAAALAAYWLTIKALRPVERMTSDAREIGTNRLHDRVAVPTSRDEIGRLAVTLNAMLDRIERGAIEQRRLIADASHELRTPLAVMRAEIDVSLRGDELSPASREVLISTLEEVDHMRRTVDNLLTLAAVDEGRLELLTVRLDLHQVIEAAAQSLQALATAKGLTLVVVGGTCEAQADQQRLRLAATNLIENAIKFTPPGGTVRVRSWRRGEEVGITVMDNGPGIPTPHCEHLFDRFYRADSSRGRSFGGSGLGLAICQEVALAHGGKVWVESAVGKGSAFSLSLPSWRALHPDEGSVAPTEASRAPLVKRG